MAEFVEFRSEEWIPELQQMERIRLFQPKEIKSIATKRKEFEYKIERKTKKKEDFLRYIQFEVDLLRIINARRDKTGINIKKGQIEIKQVNRVVKLFKQVIFRFQNDIKLWMSLFKFCEDAKQYSTVNKMLVRMLQINSNNPDLWVYAAKWELKYGKSIKNARNFLTKGLRHHPASELLFSELFKLELEHFKKKALQKEREEKNKNWSPGEVMTAILNGKVLEVIYKNSILKIEGVDFKVKLLNFAKNYSGTDSIQNLILNDIMDLHSNEELAWNAIAKTKYEGFSCDWRRLIGENEPMKSNENESEQGKKVISKKREKIQDSIVVFEEAVKRLNTTKMWSFYLDHVLDINDDICSLPVFKAKLLANAMEAAVASGHLTEKYFLQWIEVLKNSDNKNKLEEVLIKGTQQISNSLLLWHARLRFYLCKDEEEKGMKVFHEANDKLLNPSPLWELIIHYYQLKNSPKLEELFQKAMNQRGEVSKTLKPMYLEWLSQSKGISEARKIFESYHFQHPPNLVVYKTMIKIELSQQNADHNYIRKCYDLVCSYFGENDINVWLDYVKWEVKEGDVSKLHQIHRRALKNLNAEAVDEFICEYNLVIKTDLGT